MIDRVQLQHELRVLNRYEKVFTQLHKALFHDLFKLSISRYSEVRFEVYVLNLVNADVCLTQKICHLENIVHTVYLVGVAWAEHLLGVPDNNAGTFCCQHTKYHPRIDIRVCEYQSLWKV
jgi:hypothetical protein